jgi:hypothetical protein
MRDYIILCVITIIIIVIFTNGALTHREKFTNNMCDCARYDMAMSGAYDSSLPPCARKYRGTSPFDEGLCYHPELNPYWSPLNVHSLYTDEAVDVPIMRSISEHVPFV